MRICYVLAYRAPEYIRTRTLLSALELQANVECYPAINTRTGAGRYQETLSKVVEIRKAYHPDLYILGFRGHELYWPLRSIVGRKPIIFDCMMSPSLALDEEGQYGQVVSLASNLILSPIEKRILQNADFVLTDTSAHVDALKQRYRLDSDRIAAIPVGAIEQAPCAKDPGTQARLNVLFYGSFLPLHGLDVILKAASTVAHLPLEFHFIGAREATEQKIHRALGSAENSTYHVRTWAQFEEIIGSILPATDICLGGPFGNTPQARRVITGKTSQALAQAVPTIVGAGEVGAGFVDRENCLLVPQGQPEALAKALRWAHEHRDSLPALGASGQRLYRQHLSLSAIGRKLSEVLNKF